MAKLIFGCGYLGRRVAAAWLKAGETVYAVTRSSQRASEFEAAGLKPITADVTRPATLVHLPAVDTVLYAVGFDRAALKSIHEVYVDGLRNVLDALPQETGRLIYVSSTGVYGQTDGDWVDEESPCRPERAGGRACLEAERLIQAHAIAPRSVILRLAGLYGPGRIPRQDELRAGLPISAPTDGCLNLIHVDDAVSVVLAAEQRAQIPNLFTISDGAPAERRAYYEEVAHLLRAPPPQFAAPETGSPAATRAQSDKRVSNAHMLAELGVKLTYPSYREGLAAILGEEATELS
jgi:nucleoside-diphosphate-sugar epimerase